MSRLPKPRLAAAALAAALLSVLLAPTATGADEVHLELATTEQLDLPTGWQALPRAVNSSGSMVGLSFPTGLAVAWPGGSTSGYVGRPADSRSAELVDLDEAGIALGTAWYGAPDLPARPRAVVFDVQTQTWTQLPVPDGWDTNGWRMAADGTIVGLAGLDGHDMGPVAWVDGGTMVESPVVGQPLSLTPTGRVLIGLPGYAGVVWWSPRDGTTEAVDLPFSDIVVSSGNDLGQYLFGFFDTSDGLVWDSSTGVMTPFDLGSESRLNEAGQALVPAEDRWWVVDVATGERTLVAPFGLDVPASELTVFDFDENGRVLGRIVTPDVQRVFVWSSTEHTVDLGPATGPDALAPHSLAPSGVAGGSASGNNVWWRATFRLAPNAPQDLAGTAEGATVALSWEPPGSPGDAPIDAYVVKADGTEVGRVAAGDTTWSGTATGEAAYTVVAVNAYGESAPSDAVVLAASGSVTPAFTG